ncbi:tachylectin-related carbohydrate-binding protein [Saccharothrix hoggarensis]|uniref:Tachylectin-related carbohydrate-binding protein n=1 Tax=Saccharothrix hoggarensis TaxID=913853 RepID=A0ABW3QRT7_9PSEU
MALAAVVGAVLVPVVVSGGNVAGAVVAAQCKPTADFFVGMKANSELHHRSLRKPASGDRLFSAGTNLGSGWETRYMAGPNGYVYSIATTGEMHRRQWNGTGWAGAPLVSGSGWDTWNHAPHRTRITVDSDNSIYRVAPNGNLELGRYGFSTQALTTKVIDTQTDWSKYEFMFAAGNGVIYTHDTSQPGGALYRSHYDLATGAFLEREKFLGVGWPQRWFASAGGDVFYGLIGDQIWWYRYLPAEGRFTESAYGNLTQPLHSWPKVDEIAVSVDSCRLGTVAADVECAPSANFWGFANDNTMTLRPHTEPETGITAWAPSTQAATGWTHRFLSAPNGYKYFVANGELRRHRWVDGAWDNNGQYAVIATGWGDWEDVRYRYRYTVDSSSAFYLVPASGVLERRVYDDTAKTWTSEVLDTGWGRYDHVFAAGDGVLYARDPAVENGAVYRHHYDTTSRRWLDHGTKVATGWNKYRNLVSPGADVIYGFDGNYLDWRRWDVTAGKFATSAAGATVEQVWWWADMREISADIDACSLVTPPNPVLPTVAAPSNERAQMIYNTASQRLEVAYVHDNGVLHHGYQLAGSEAIEFSALAGYLQHTGRATLAQRQDGRVVVAATSLDGQADTYAQDGVGGRWTGPTPLQGAFPTSPALVRGSNNLLTAFAVNGDGKLWYAEQFDAAGGFRPWRQASGDPGYTMTSNFAVVPSGDGFEVAYHNPSGVVAVKRFQSGTIQPQRIAGGITAVGSPAAVVFADGKVQLVSRGSDGRLHTQKEGASGFGGWTDISDGLTFTGSPTALLNTHGIVEVVARTQDGMVHRNGQTAPGSATWRNWETNLDSAVTDPVLTAATGNEQRAFFRDGSGSYYLWHLTAYTSTPTVTSQDTGQSKTVAIRTTKGRA